MNNFAENQICRYCGCYLKTHNTTEQSQFGLETRSLFLIFKITAAAIVCVFAGAFLYNYGLRPSSGSPQNSLAAIIQGQDLKIPDNSWYKPNDENEHRLYPTVKEIIDKNNRVTSSIMQPQDVVSLSMKASVGFDEVGCFTPECAQKQREKESAGMRNDGFAPAVQADNRARDNRIFIYDEYNKFNYKKAGRGELYQKKPDKTLQKIMVDPNDIVEKAEVTQGYNGTIGWKKEIIYKTDQSTKTSVESLSDEELENFKKSMGTMFQGGYDDANLVFSGLASVNGRINFVIDKKKENNTESFYFDAITGVLNKFTSKEVIVHLCAYENSFGVYMPSKMYFRFIAKNGMVVWMKMDNIVWNFNPPLADSIFEKPAL